MGRGGSFQKGESERGTKERKREREVPLHPLLSSQTRWGFGEGDAEVAMKRGRCFKEGGRFDCDLPQQDKILDTSKSGGACCGEAGGDERSWGCCCCYYYCSKELQRVGCKGDPPPPPPHTALCKGFLAHQSWWKGLFPTQMGLQQDIPVECAAACVQCLPFCKKACSDDQQQQ